MTSQITTQHTAETNRELIATLWARARWGSDLAAFYRDQLAGMNQTILAAAIVEVKRTRSTFADNPPELVWILHAYDSIMATNVNSTAWQRADIARRAEAQRVAADESATLAALLTHSRDVIATAVQALRCAGWISTAPLPSSVADWRPNTRSFVRAWIDSHPQPKESAP